MDRIICGNNLEILKDESLIPSNSVRLCFTSPPYPGMKKKFKKAMEKGGGAGYTHGGKLNFENMAYEDYAVAMVDLFRAIERVMMPYGTVMLNMKSPANEHGCRTMLTWYTAISIDTYTKFKLYEENFWYNICAPTARFPYRLKPTLEYVLWFVYLPTGFSKKWQSNITFHKKDLQTEFGTSWETQKRKLESKQERKFAQSGHSYEDKTYFAGEGKDLENVFFFANTRNSQTEKLKIVRCDKCDNRERIFGKDLSVLKQFRPDWKKKADDQEQYIMCSKCGSCGAETVGHGAVFPEALARLILMGWSDPGDIVLDPFMGSGTLAVASKQFPPKEQRRYIGIDISPNYVALAEEKVDFQMKVQQQSLF